MAALWTNDNEKPRRVHYRIHIAILHIKGESIEDQPEIKAVSFLAIRSKERVAKIYAQLVLIAKILMGGDMTYSDNRSYNQDKVADWE